MTLNEFRIAHSALIEQYQYIEAHLEGIYAAVSGKAFYEGLKDVERDSVKRITDAIKAIEKKEGVHLFAEEEYEEIHRIFQRRNFWCHNCYFDLTFDSKTGGPKRPEVVRGMANDLLEAERLRDALFERKVTLMENGV